MIKIGTRYVYYRCNKAGTDWERLPCRVVGGPFYRNTRYAVWEIEVDGHTQTRFVSAVSLVTEDGDAAGVRRYQASRDRPLGD